PWTGFGQQAPTYQAPTQQPFAMMPWGGQTVAPRYQTPASPYSNMMPWSSFTGQAPTQQVPQNSFMAPGMEQGMRSMMQPGRIWAEEATPGMYVKPTWR
ncbi:MAG: hypothetical protein ISR69_05640, partial [Gammaproteobacteria bacterium]|nr:hypothetical protein [Gammaproteobacteria bacterium]